MSSCSLSLQEFLAEAELQHYHNALWNDLKVTGISQLKYVQEDDLTQIGMSRPEQRRLKKFFNKYYPQSYLGKFVKIIHTKTSSSSSSQTGCSSRRNSGVEQWEVRRDLAGKHVAASPRNASNITKHVIPISSIELGQLLGTGHFGSVHQAVLTDEEGHSKQVAVKCLENERIQCSPMELMNEAAIFHSLEHDRILRFYGAALTVETDPSVWLVTELAPHRCLLECLRDPLLKSNLTVMTLCDVAVQICEGMKYLETKRIVHGDLSARNVLVFPKMKVKVGDVALSRILGGESAETNMRHAAWYPPDTLRTNQFTCSSDVWSFGVTIWEIFSFGMEPWANLTGMEIMAHVESAPAPRLEQPDLCPKDYYKIMLDSWSLQECDRPTFAQLSEILPDKKPEQVRAIVEYLASSTHCRNTLQFAIGDVIVVLDNSPEDGSHFWKGVVKSRKPGLFDPSDTVTYLGSDMLPESGNQSTNQFSAHERNLFVRKSKIRRDMISRPQGDFRHTGHVGMDGAYFGDISFLDKGFGPVHSLARPYDKAEDERSMGYGGSRDTTPLISSRMSIPRTVGSESRMSTESWQNTSSDSPRSGSSRSSGNTKENHPSPISSRKTSISSPQPTIWKASHNHSCHSSRGDDQSADRYDGVNKPSLANREKRFIQTLHTQDDKEFDLDFGPSFAEEVFGVINENCGNSDSLSSMSDLKSSPPRERNPGWNFRLNSDVEKFSNNSSEMQNALLPKILRPIEILPARLVPAAQEKLPQVVVPVNAPPNKPTPPTKPPKPLALARKKKLDPISVVREESAAINSIKPASPRDERLIEDFIDSSNEFAARSLALHSNGPSPSPAATSKSRFSFRFRNKPSENLPPEKPKIFLTSIQPQERNLADQVSEEAKEAYRVLVEEGQIKIHCSPPSPSHNFDENEQEEFSSSPLKLLRNGVGVVPKQRGNRNGLANGFNRSVSHETPRAVLSPVIPGATIGTSQSFCFSSKPEETLLTEPLTLNSIVAPPVDASETNGAKKAERPKERPNVPPPLPPRDRSRPLMGQSFKPRERQYPLMMPGSGDDYGNGISQLDSGCHYQNPETDGLVVEKSSTAFRKLSNGQLSGSNSIGFGARSSHSVSNDQEGREVSF